MANEANRSRDETIRIADRLRKFHEDESGIAMTEYIIVFSLITFGGVMALLATGMYVKGYRDFLVWWYAHPAV